MVYFTLLVHVLPKLQRNIILNCYQLWCRFRIWHDGIHYLEIAATRGYDHGEVRLVAENDYGREEARTNIEIYQGHDLRSVLHRGSDKIAGRVDSSLKQYRIMKNMENNLRGAYCAPFCRFAFLVLFQSLTISQACVFCYFPNF